MIVGIFLSFILVLVVNVIKIRRDNDMKKLIKQPDSQIAKISLLAGSLNRDSDEIVLD